MKAHIMFTSPETSVTRCLLEPSVVLTRIQFWLLLMIVTGSSHNSVLRSGRELENGTSFAFSGQTIWITAGAEVPGSDLGSDFGVAAGGAWTTAFGSVVGAGGASGLGGSTAGLTTAGTASAIPDRSWILSSSVFSSSPLDCRATHPALYHACWYPTKLIAIWQVQAPTSGLTVRLADWIPKAVYLFRTPPAPWCRAWHRSLNTTRCSAYRIRRKPHGFRAPSSAGWSRPASW